MWAKGIRGAPRAMAAGPAPHPSESYSPEGGLWRTGAACGGSQGRGYSPSAYSDISFIPAPMSLHKDLLPPLWATIAATVATLATNWIWGAWFAQAQGTGLAALMIYSLFGWPLMLAVIYLVLGYALKLCENQVLVRVAIVLGVIGAGIALYGVPGPWNLLLCTALALTIGLKARRTAQDDADLEQL